jgi:hypothetical protein
MKILKLIKNRKKCIGKEIASMKVKKNMDLIEKRVLLS